MTTTFFKYLLNRSEKIYRKNSFSTNGEDILINAVLKKIANGFYLDVGAHHPFRFSNTHLLYKNGWRGLNIDASRKSIDLFNKYRPGDINIVSAISEREEELVYYSNQFGALNTVSKKRYDEFPQKFDKKTRVKTTTLKDVLDKVAIPNGVNFLNIDIEGYDLKALNSFPWEIYRPELVCVEDLDFNIESPSNSKIYNFMINRNYKFYALIPQTLFFVSE